MTAAEAQIVAAYRRLPAKFQRRLRGTPASTTRSQRKTFERFLLHPDERVRRYGKELVARGLQARNALRQERLAEEAEGPAWESEQDIDGDAEPHDIGVDLSDNLSDDSDRRRSWVDGF